jgi:hypothetical protein
MQPCTIYKGVIITNCDGAYKAIGKLYATLQLAKDAIDASFIIIAESIKNNTCVKQAAAQSLSHL